MYGGSEVETFQILIFQKHDSVKSAEMVVVYLPLVVLKMDDNETKQILNTYSSICFHRLKKSAKKYSLTTALEGTFLV